MFSEFNYIPRRKRENGKWVKQDMKAAAKATLGYIGHRVGKEKEKMDRTLFGHGGALTDEQVERMIDEAPGNTYFFRLILSPDPNGENQERNLDLWKLTKDIVELLEQRLGRENLHLWQQNTTTTPISRMSTRSSSFSGGERRC
jgi:hypothetical protein